MELEPFITLLGQGASLGLFTWLILPGAQAAVGDRLLVVAESRGFPDLQGPSQCSDFLNPRNVVRSSTLSVTYGCV